MNKILLILFLIGFLPTTMIAMEEDRTNESIAMEEDRTNESIAMEEDRTNQSSELPFAPEIIENIYLNLAPTPPEEFKSGEELYNAIRDALPQIRKNWAIFSATSHQINEAKPLSFEQLRKDQVRTLFRRYIQKANKSNTALVTPKKESSLSVFTQSGVGGNLLNNALITAINKQDTLVAELLYKMGGKICRSFSDPGCTILRDAVLHNNIPKIELILKLWSQMIKDDPRTIQNQKELLRPYTQNFKARKNTPKRRGVKPYVGFEPLDPVIVYAIDFNNFGVMYSLINYGWDLLGWQFIEDLFCLKNSDDESFQKVMEAITASENLEIKNLALDTMNTIIKIKGQTNKGKEEEEEEGQ